MVNLGDTGTVRLIVADDEALVRGGITMLLAPHLDLEVVAQVEDGEKAIEQARLLQPDLVVMDARMPRVDGVAAARAIVEASLDADHLIKVLMLTTFNDDEVVFGALRAGASGFLVKDQAPAHLVEAIRAVADGGGWIDSSVAGRVLATLSATPQPGRPVSSVLTRLTGREQEVLVLMASGLSNADISSRLVLSDATVRTHVSRILMKTGSRDRTQAVVLAYQSGLVTINRAK